MSEYEREIVKVLIDTEDFTGRSEIADQLAIARVEEIDPDGSLRVLVPSLTRAPVKVRVPVMGQFVDTDGIQGHLLLHVVNGRGC